LLQLTVVARDAAEAASVSNVWAATFATFANDVYRQTETTPLDDQVASAHSEYDAAQAALVSFLNSNQIDELNLGLSSRIDRIRQVRDAYDSAEIASLQTALIAETRIPLLLVNAVSLRDQLEAGGTQGQTTIGAQLAQLYLEASSLSTGASLPGNIQVELTSLDAENGDPTTMRAALDQLITTLTALQKQLNGSNTAAALALLNAPNLDGEVGDAIRLLQGEIDVLSAEIEGELTTKRELETNRDRAWDRYLLLQQKQSEIAIVSATSDTEVVPFADALTPTRPAAPNVPLNVALGMALGLTASVTVAFVRAQLREEASVAL
jgi:LPS O-antigen subunit length determinant protein (WzzB/FepE family)